MKGTLGACTNIRDTAEKRLLISLIATEELTRIALFKHPHANLDNLEGKRSVTWHIVTLQNHPKSFPR